MGTIINIATVLIGGSLGLIFGRRLPERVRQTVVTGLGLFTAALGLRMFLKTEHAIVVLVSLLLGGLLGEWWRIEDGLRNIAVILERRFSGGKEKADIESHPSRNSNFVRGFLTASLVFCVGPITILGSIEDGLTGNYQTLAIKSVLDGFAALAFSSTLGVGVLFSVLVIGIYQGGLTLLAAQAQSLITTPMQVEMTAAGGVILIGIAVSSLLEIKPIRVENFLPALVVAPLLVAILSAIGILSKV
jgi:uncharacterized membrane protein YqgA involved in biofilm formation